MKTVLKITYEDYLKIDDDKQYEVIEGELKMVPAPSFEHQGISYNLSEILRGYIKGKNLGIIRYSPLDVVLDKTNIVQPDFVFISTEHKNIIHDGKVFGSPDLVIEIISKGSKHTDYFKKKDLYEKSGITEYWLVDPFSESVEVLTLDESNKYDLYSEGFMGDTIKSQVLIGLEIAIEEIFKKDW